MRVERTSNNYRKELKKKVLKVAMHEFFKKGIRAVKMDDIASILSISKRTLYEMYPNKEELLIEGICLYNEEKHNHMYECSTAPGSNVMDVLMEFYNMQLESVNEITPLFFADLQKYEKAKKFIDSNRQKQEEKAERFFQKGVKQGYFREGIDYQIITVAGLTSMQAVLHNEKIVNKGLKNIYHNIVGLFMRGLCTMKGLEILEERLK